VFPQRRIGSSKIRKAREIYFSTQEPVGLFGA
jgi:hypothetical protein